MLLPLTRHNAVRTALQGPSKLLGYLAIWGDTNRVDCVGTWFDRDNPPDLGLGKRRGEYDRFLPARLLYEHGADPEVGTDIIGEITRVWEDELGIAFEGSLFTDSPHYPRVRAELEAEELSTSSSTAGHTANFGEDNHFDVWHLHEHTLTKSPCEGEMPTVQLRARQKANYHSMAAFARASDRFTRFADALLYQPLAGPLVANQIGRVEGFTRGVWVVQAPDGSYWGFPNEAVGRSEVGLVDYRALLKAAAAQGIARSLGRFRKAKSLYRYDILERSGHRFLALEAKGAVPRGYTKVDHLRPCGQ